MLPGMDVLKMLAELKQERTHIEEAIIAIEHLAMGQGKRRGRPPAWRKEASAPKRRGRPPGSKNAPQELLREHGELLEKELRQHRQVASRLNHARDTDAAEEAVRECVYGEPAPLWGKTKTNKIVKAAFSEIIKLPRWVLFFQ